MAGRAKYPVGPILYHSERILSQSETRNLAVIWKVRSVGKDWLPLSHIYKVLRLEAGGILARRDRQTGLRLLM